LNRPYSEQGVQPDIPITVRSAARPPDDPAWQREDATFGDPKFDPMLAAAIRTARNQLGAAH
jgi:hypothetical protein